MKNLRRFRLAVNQFSFTTPLDERIKVDLLDSLFCPDVTPASESSEKKGGEYRLWRAILEDALLVCLRHYSASSTSITKTTISDAEAWVISDEEHPGSFVFVCAALSLEPSFVRRLLEDARRERAA